MEELQKAVAMLQARGARPEVINAYIMSKSGMSYEQYKQLFPGPGPITLDDAGRSLAQGATFDFADELYGAKNAAMGTGEYGPSRDSVRANDRRFRREHPSTDKLLRFAGGVPTALATGGVAAGATAATPTVGRLALQGATAGAGFGALQGAGASEDSTAAGVAGDAAMGGGAGALVGAGLGTAVGGARAGLSKLQALFQPEQAAATRASQTFLQAIEEGTYKDPRAAFGTAPSMGAGAQGAQGVADIYQQMRPGQATVADLSPELTSYADVAASRAPSVNAAGQAQMSARQSGMAPRLQQQLATEARLPGPPRAMQAQQRTDLRAIGDQFKALEDQGLIISEKSVTAALQRPTTRKAFAAAQKSSADAGIALPANLVQIFADEGKPVAQFSELQQAKETLDDMVTSAFKNGKGQLATKLRAARDELVNAIEDGAPGYKEINAKYRGQKAVMRAFADGRSLLYQPADAVMAARDALQQNPQALEALRLGMVSKMVEQLGSAKQGANVASDITMAGPEMQEKLKLLFPDFKAFERFMKQAHVEAALARAYTRFGKNSATQQRQVLDEAAFGDTPPRLQLGAAAANPIGAAAGVAQRAMDAAPGDLKPRIAKMLGEMLLRPASETQLLLQGADATRSALLRSGKRTAGASAGGAALLARQLPGPLGIPQ